MWPRSDLLDLLRIVQPIVQAPMSGFATPALAAAVANAGGLGSLVCVGVPLARVQPQAGEPDMDCEIRAHPAAERHYARNRYQRGSRADCNRDRRSPHRLIFTLVPTWCRHLAADLNYSIVTC